MSVRYAADNHFLIARGEARAKKKGKRSPGNEQYFGNALLLTDRQEFLGADYSPGDHYIQDVADRVQGPGTPKTWIAAAINPYMTLGARQVADL
jgi:hypothetical protein